MKSSLSILAGLAAGICCAVGAEVDTSLDQIPAKAAESLRHLAGGAAIKHVSKEVTDGKTVFEASFKADGGIREVTVDEKGALVSEEQTVALSAVPEAVQKTIAAQSAGGKLEKLERVQEHGKTTYEALLSAKGKRTEIVMDAKGKVLETEDKTKDPDKD